MKEKSPSFQMYPKQILGDDKVLAMDWDALGMHHWLLWISWQQEPAGTIPDDDATIRRWLRSPSDDIWRRVRPQIMAAWPIQDGRRVNAGMVRTKRRQDIYKENGSKKAKSQQSQEDEEDAVLDSGVSVFEKAYECYPRKVKPRTAEKAWGQAVNREAKKGVSTYAEIEDFLYQRVMTYAAACARFHKPKEFIPYMASWLNADQFLDDPTEWEVTRQEQRNGNARADERHTQSTAEIDSAVARLSGRAAEADQSEIPTATGNGSPGSLVGRLAKAMPGGGGGSV